MIRSNRMTRYLILVLFFSLLYFPISDAAFAYIGPGAGFAVLSSFFMIFIAFFLAAVNLISWPLRYVWKQIRGKNAYKTAKVKKVVVLGLDGLDWELTDKFIKQGKLPSFKKLEQEGRFAPLQTTFPSISPVAWSSFQTGVNPAKHNIFDFLSPDWKSYLPVLSSTLIGNVKKNLNIAGFQIPLGKPVLRLLRKSVPFWNILGDKGIFTNIIRVPITFPPEKGSGLLLGAMCIPDIRGTQGSFTFYTSQKEQKNYTGGTRLVFENNNGKYTSHIPGPPNPVKKVHKTIDLPFELSKNSKGVVMNLNGKKIDLQVGEYTDWVRLVFKTGTGININGICRFLLKSWEPYVELYITPINIDPDKPALPISSPAVYSTYLAKKLGPFATLGLAEDTWALNENVINEEQFLKQAWDIHDERERMFFDALENLDRGVLALVFDSTDRIQHTFMRYLHDDHPANEGRDREIHKNAIEHLYTECDKLIEKITNKLDDDTLFIVMSDHGFKPFKRGININRWLYDNGYLVLKEDGKGGEWFDGVDWEKTKAYALGLAGIYLNRKGREGKGTVGSAEALQIKAEIIEKLHEYRDPERNEIAINQVFDSGQVMSGPYLKNAPDLIVGYKPGYRASWASVTGTVMEDIFTDNTKAWSGDHCMDPRTVPGVFFSNKKVSDEYLSIMDIAPTVLDMFGLKPPAYMDGKVLSVTLKEK